MSLTNIATKVVAAAVNGAAQAVVPGVAGAVMSRSLNMAQQVQMMNSRSLSSLQIPPVNKAQVIASGGTSSGPATSA